MNITASLQIKNNIYQVVLNYKDINGKRKQKWVSTGLSQKGNNKRVILLKDKTKNQSSYRTLPLVDDIIVLLKEHKKQIDENKKLCGNSYNNTYERNSRLTWSFYLFYYC